MKTLEYTIDWFGTKYNVQVERKTKGDAFVRVILFDENNNELFKWISALSAKQAAKSAICAYRGGLMPNRF